MAKKLNSMRILEQHNIEYEVFEFDDSIHSAEGVADSVGVPLDTVYKTLVVLPDDKNARNRPMLVLVSAGRQLDLKQLATEIDLKKVGMAGHDQAEKLTGLKVGGISPLALTSKNWNVYIDARALDHDKILLSAGKRGVNLRVDRAKLMEALDIKAVDCSRSA